MICPNNYSLKTLVVSKKIRISPFSLLMIFPIINLTHATDLSQEKTRSFPNPHHNLYNAPISNATTLDNDLINYYQRRCEIQDRPETTNFIEEPGVDLLGELNEEQKKEIPPQFMTELEEISDAGDELKDDEAEKILKQCQALEEAMLSHEKNREMNKSKDDLLKKAGIATRETIPPLLGLGLGTGAGFGGMALITATGFSIPIVGPVVTAVGIGVLSGLGTWAGLRGGIPQIFEEIPQKTVEFLEDLFKQKNPTTSDEIIKDFELIVHEK